MGVFDKIKNALFEEEYVEVEEKPKKVKSRPAREKIKKEKISKPSNDSRTSKDNKPIAKKVIIPEKKEPVVDEIAEKPMDEDFDMEPLLSKSSDDNFKFPMVDDSEFNNDNDYNNFDNKYDGSTKDYNQSTPIKEKTYSKFSQTEKYNDKKYQKKKEKNLYGIDESEKINVHEYGVYEKDKKIFRPSPIISPIYGVLDKNYKKEEIVTKKEVRLTSSYARENLSVDDVRNKAYGSLSDDITREIEDEGRHAAVESFEDTNDELMVDLSSNIDKPQVHEITMGDAEEYFQDLGLEYNIDYKDASKEKATGRRSEVTEEKKESKEVKEENKEKKVQTEELDDNDNLFDLIDSMYEEENKE